MATWVDLTQEQKDVYQQWERDLRAAQGGFARVINSFNRINQTYNAQIQGILADLDDNTIVPNSSGLSGSAALDSDAEAVTLQSHVQSVLASFDTAGHQTLRDKAAGGPNTAGEL